jgi:peptidase E
MTKLILNGGFNSGNEQEDNSDFYAEILKDAPEGAKVLIVPFAKDADRIPNSITKVKAGFNKSKWQDKIDFDVANEESFIEQIKSSDVVYLQGGRTLKLLSALKKFPDFKEAIKGKTVAGESAGANVFGKIFYSPSADGVFEGLSILPIKVIPHYKEEYRDVFKDAESELENLFLQEYEYKVFEI